MVGFPQYTYPAALPMLRVAIKLGAFPMPGVGAVPPEGMGGLAQLAQFGVELASQFVAAGESDQGVGSGEGWDLGV
jgi:hypothetical protein